MALFMVRVNNRIVFEPGDYLVTDGRTQIRKVNVISEDLNVKAIPEPVASPVSVNPVLTAPKLPYKRNVGSVTKKFAWLPGEQEAMQSLVLEVVEHSATPLPFRAIAQAFDLHYQRTPRDYNMLVHVVRTMATQGKLTDVAIGGGRHKTIHAYAPPATKEENA